MGIVEIKFKNIKSMEKYFCFFFLFFFKYRILGKFKREEERGTIHSHQEKQKQNKREKIKKGGGKNPNFKLEIKLTPLETYLKKGLPFFLIKWGSRPSQKRFKSLGLKGKKIGPPFFFNNKVFFFH